LNLNRIQQPAILGVRTGQLSDRFSFVSYTDDLDLDHPWGSLDKTLENGVIPAIADQTVIQWGLGLKIGDTLVYKDELGQELKLLLIGGLANSIFQGHVIISDQYFLDHFPSSSGSTFMLLDDVDDQELAVNELGMGLRDFGLDIETSAQKLAEFNSIENTYLTIFMVLGAFGLLLGTIGLGVILVRNLLERKQELALLKAMGYSNGLILRLILNEYVGLLIGGLLAGGISAIIAVLPGLIKPHSEVSIAFLVLMTGVILLNGILWIVILAYSIIRKSDLVESLRND
jgi:ABC-type antimicrobial peptide transport system permease subunit